jgi:hypothetical protein
VRLLQSVLPGASHTKQPPQPFVAQRVRRLLRRPGHATLRHLNRSSSSHAWTCAPWDTRDFACVARNQAALAQGLPPAPAQACVIDARCSPHSDPKTSGLARFWPSRHSRCAKGLAIAALPGATSPTLALPASVSHRHPQQTRRPTPRPHGLPALWSHGPMGSRRSLCATDAPASPMALTAHRTAPGGAVPWGTSRGARCASTPIDALAPRGRNAQAQAVRKPLTARYTSLQGQFERRHAGHTRSSSAQGGDRGSVFHGQSQTARLQATSHRPHGSAGSPGVQLGTIQS